jgi:hypothetical protein
MKTTLLLIFSMLIINAHSQDSTNNRKDSVLLKKSEPVIIESLEGNGLQFFKAAKIGIWQPNKKWGVMSFLGVGAVNENQVMNPNYSPDLFYVPYFEIGFTRRFLKVFHLHGFVGANKYREYFGYGGFVKIGNHLMLGANYKEKYWDGVIYFKF